MSGFCFSKRFMSYIPTGKETPVKSTLCSNSSYEDPIHNKLQQYYLIKNNTYSLSFLE